MASRRSPLSRSRPAARRGAQARRRAPTPTSLLARPLRLAIVLSLCGFALAGVALRSRSR